MARLRLAARMVVLAPDDRTLLMRWRNPRTGREWWATPGGGIEEGESMLAAARRELLEETGLVPVEEWGPVYDHEHFFRSRTELVHQRESFFAARVGTTDVDTSGFDEMEMEDAVGNRWWTVEQMERSTEAIYPEELPDIVRGCLQRRPVTPGGVVKLVDAHRGARLAVARQLIAEYAEAVDTDADPCLADLGSELESLPGEYRPPSGCLLVAMIGARPAGVVALRRVDDATAEMKRLYVPPAHRRYGVARRLAARVVGRAVAAGYERLVLDTMPSMVDAIALYRRMGFQERQTNGVAAGALTFELDLASLREAGERPGASI